MTRAPAPLATLYCADCLHKRVNCDMPDWPLKEAITVAGGRALCLGHAATSPELAG